MRWYHVKVKRYNLVRALTWGFSGRWHCGVCGRPHTWMDLVTIIEDPDGFETGPTEWLGADMQVCHDCLVARGIKRSGDIRWIWLRETARWGH